MGKEDSQYSLRERILLLVVPRVVSLLISWLIATLHFEESAEPGADPFAPVTRAIGCFWHQGLLSSTCYFTGRPVTVLVSNSLDGELIARSVQRLGFKTARGSSSRGGVGGLRDLMNSLKQNIPAYFTADGPRGPRYELKPGPIKLAQLTRLPIRTFHVYPERHWKLKSWDRMMIPKPFSRVVICWSHDVPVKRELSEEAFEAARQQVEAALERARHLAEQYFTS
jgi:lysophospholipid acyltransferase (LPLAT)-like uncharacterized protein